MALILKGLFGQIPYGQDRASTEISQSDIIDLLKQYVKPATIIQYKYTKDEAITLGVQDAVREIFGTLPSTPQPISLSELNTLIDKALTYARNYYMMTEEVPAWEWPS